MTSYLNLPGYKLHINACEKCAPIYQELGELKDDLITSLLSIAFEKESLRQLKESNQTFDATVALQTKALHLLEKQLEAYPLGTVNKCNQIATHYLASQQPLNWKKHESYRTKPY